MERWYGFIYISGKFWDIRGKRRRGVVVISLGVLRIDNYNEKLKRG